MDNKYNVQSFSNKDYGKKKESYASNLVKMRKMKFENMRMINSHRLERTLQILNQNNININTEYNEPPLILRERKTLMPKKTILSKSISIDKDLDGSEFHCEVRMTSPKFRQNEYRTIENISYNINTSPNSKFQSKHQPNTYKNIDKTMSSKFTQNFWKELYYNKKQEKKSFPSMFEEIFLTKTSNENSNKDTNYLNDFGTTQNYHTTQTQTLPSIRETNVTLQTENTSIRNNKSLSKEKDLKNILNIKNFSNYKNSAFDHKSHLQMKYMNFKQLFKSKQEINVNSWNLSLTRELERITKQYQVDKIDTFRKFCKNEKTEKMFNSSADKRYNRYKIVKIEVSKVRPKLKPINHRKGDLDLKIDQISENVFHSHKSSMNA
jgi:hypothetical protein